MTRKAKLFEKLSNKASDKSWSFDEAERVLIEGGFVHMRTRGSHHTYRRNAGEVFTLPRQVPAVKAVYIAQIRRYLIEK